MRGKEGGIEAASYHARITPAHAGKRRVAMPAARICRDHPRPCGEKLPRIESADGDKGSPPPMRGKEGERPYSSTVPRITPAHAGKSVLS